MGLPDEVRGGATRRQDVQSFGRRVARQAIALGPRLRDALRRRRPARERVARVEDPVPWSDTPRAERDAAGRGWMLGLERAMFVAVVLGGTLGGILAASHLAPSLSGIQNLTQLDQGSIALDQGRPGPAGSPAPFAATATGPAAIRSPSPAATPMGGATPGTAAGQRMRVAHTDGQGVVLRASPRIDDRTSRGFEEGDTVTVLERSGPDWARVRGTNGQEGWVPARYLDPAP